ncbi:MAG: hypothetical protein GY719_19390 [bacterium]|nr:hypothetical protein [bacterium]
MTRLPTGLSVSTAWLGALGLSCLSLGCARTADERVLAISRLLEEARSFQAEQYSPEAFQRAEDLLSRTRLEIETQKTRPWYMSTDRRARELLQASEAAASLVRAEAAAAAVRARKDAVQAMGEAHLAVDRASEAYWRSPRGKDTHSDLRRMRSDLDSLTSDLTEAEVALEQGDFLIAGRLATAVQDRATTVARTIDRAMAYRLGELAADEVSPGVPESPARAPASLLGVASRPGAEATRFGRRAG